MTALKKWIMVKNFDGVQFAYFQYFHYNFTVTRNALRKVERHKATDRLSCSTVVFLLNELFVTIHVDNILNTDNNE